MGRPLYQSLRELIKPLALPAMIVDLDMLETNSDRIAAIVRAQSKSLRIATKSVRCVDLLKLLLERHSDIFRGLMCYSAREALFLARRGFDDFLVAYPSTHHADLSAAVELVKMGKSVCLMLDCETHMRKLADSWRANGMTSPLRVCIDVDVSYRPLGGVTHIGVQRSPIRSLADFSNLYRKIRARRELRLVGVMAYEAQIAGVTDRNPFSPVMNWIKAAMKRFSIRDVARRRQEIAEFLKHENFSLDIFNAGGTGSLCTSSREPWVSEVTAGSGFLQSHLFDYYAANTNEPALFFALNITRKPEANIVTCQFGGFMASGEISQDKAPVVYQPPGLQPFSRESFGEVQTPFKNCSGIELNIDDPVFCRPAKAGEIAEWFSEYHLKRADKIVGSCKTYRGEGFNFGEEL